MAARERKELAGALARALVGGAGPVLAIDVEPFEGELDGLELARARWTGETAVLSDGGSALPESFDAVVIGAAEDTWETAERASGAVRDGGTIVLVLPELRAGLAGATGRALGLVAGEGRRPRALEEICGALLGGGARDIRVEPIAGAHGWVVVHGVVARPRLDEPAPAPEA